MKSEMLMKLIENPVSTTTIDTVDPYQLQSELLNNYHKVNPAFLISLDYESNLNDKLYLRQMIAYFEEEILEFGEQYQKVVNLVLNNEQDRDKLQTEIWYMFEELADIYHFLLELFILSGISQEEIAYHVKQLLKPLGLSSPNEITGSFIYAGSYLNKDNDIHVSAGRANPNMLFDNANLIMGCNKVSSSFLKGLEIHLHRFTNFSKNANRQISYKPWKLKNKPTNVTLYKEHLFNAYLYFFVLLVYLGVDEYTIKFAFKFKHDINKDRILSGY